MSTEQKIDDGGPAFPASDHHYAEGMSLRDYFAGQALTGLHADSQNMSSNQQNAAIAYEAADAMLLARKGAAK